ncbi:uncharacterized protein LOC115238788 [Formica exsecta]|uniref:uncharacterized protein LOC115238788 n=1 Tax=Formica exsecta TaxID=72781 RepID=UPI001143BD85|nr:uncharacterized protein LOC115238788 [Formica exsecta]
MTLSVPWTRWRMYLALVLIYQTARRVEGHPRALTKTSQNTRNPWTQETSISKLIEEAFDRLELLRPEQWPQQTKDHLVTRSLDRDTSRQSEYLNDGISTPGERRLEVASTDASMQMDVDEKIIFPTDGRVTSTPAPASGCHKSIFCENVADYPRQLVNAAIARNASLRFLESIDPMPDIEQRIDTTDEVPLCRYSEQVVYPQTAQNKEKQWLFIVNQDNLKQGIRIEVCLNDGQECNMIQGFAEGYKTSCKQKYIYRELAAVGSSGNIVKDQFRFPSSCCCHVKFIGDPTVRLGLGLDLRSFNQTTATVSKTRWRQ